MIPRLYESNETAFLTNGLGGLPDAISCTVTEERNGQYELAMTYPVTGLHFADILEERLIMAVPADGKDAEPFRVYRISKPLNGIVEINAQHISYDLKKMTVKPFRASTCAGAVASIVPNTAGGSNPFTFWTDKEVVKDFNLKIPKQIRSILGGESGSLLDVYGTAEFEFHRMEVKMHAHRGADRGVTIRYGKNLTGIEHEIRSDSIYTAVVPYWQNEDDAISLPEPVQSDHVGDFSHPMIIPLDLSNEFDQKPTEAQLREKALAWMAAHECWELDENIRMSFVPLWQSEEYRDYVSAIERVNLCDTVSVIHETLGVTARAKVIKTVYNVLLDRYDSIELGNAKSTNLSNAISRELEKAEVVSKTSLEQAIENATNAIAGGKGGYVMFNYNADGKPEELLIMDTDSILTAVNVWRWNKNGLGFSSTGYNGTYRTAITADGHVVADFIDTGSLTANIIKSGVLSALEINNGNGTFHVDPDGKVEASNITITGGSIKIETGDDTVDTLDLRLTRTASNGLLTERRVLLSASGGLTVYTHTRNSSGTVDTKKYYTVGPAGFQRGTWTGTIDKPTQTIVRLAEGGAMANVDWYEGSNQMYSVRQFDNGSVYILMTIRGVLQATSGNHMLRVAKISGACVPTYKVVMPVMLNVGTGNAIVYKPSIACIYPDGSVDVCMLDTDPHGIASGADTVCISGTYLLPEF